MLDYDYERMCLDICIECGKEIAVEEERVLIYQDYFGEYWVHWEECLENYKKLLIGPEAIEQGLILGICYICCKPVRQKQRYLVGRTKQGQRPTASKTDDPFYTAFPSSENKDFLLFAHEECEKSEGNDLSLGESGRYISCREAYYDKGKGGGWMTKNSILRKKREQFLNFFENEIFNSSEEIKDNPNNAEAYFNRGLAYGEKGNNAKSISDLTRAIRINPKYGDAYRCRAMDYFWIGNFKKSWQDVHKAKALGAKINSKFLKDLKKASGRGR